MREVPGYRVLRNGDSLVAPIGDGQELAGVPDPDCGVEVMVGRGELLANWPPLRLRSTERASPTRGVRTWLVGLRVGQRVRELVRRIGGSLGGSGRDRSVGSDARGHTRHDRLVLVAVPMERAGRGVRAPLRAVPAGRSRPGHRLTLDRSAIRSAIRRDVENHPRAPTDAGHS
jgi:hypothetical protein